MSRAVPLLLLAALLLAAVPAEARRQRTHVVRPGDTPAALARRYGVPVDELLRYNNLLDKGHFRVGTKLDIPFEGEVTGREYVVRPGDSVARVADFHGVSQDDLRALNDLGPAEGLRVGQTILIPAELRGGAARGHVVRKGDTLASIAAKHNVQVGALARANKLGRDSNLQLGRTLIIPEPEEPAAAPAPRNTNKLVESGEKVAGGVLHTVQPGQSLWIIARAYNTTGERIRTANEIEEGVGIAAGQKLLIPGVREVVPVRVKGFVVQPVSFVSVWNNERASLVLMTRSGRVNQRSRRILSRLAGPKRKTKRVKLLHPRLIHMLQRVAERFPGHTIEIVSGYRPRKPGQRPSKHNQGRAVDFRVRGVERQALYEYIKTLPRVGAGYYPNSVFVHLDVREETALWTDHSGVGEAADYSGEGAADPEAAADRAVNADNP